MPCTACTWQGADRSCTRLVRAYKMESSDAHNLLCDVGISALFGRRLVNMTSRLGFRANVASTACLQARPVRPAAPARAPLVVEARTVIRFTRFGRKHKPHFRIVAIDAKKRREGRPLEYLGYYNPLSKAVSLDAPRIKYWLGVGALPSESVGKLLRKAMVIEDTGRHGKVVVST